VVCSQLSGNNSSQISGNSISSTPQFFDSGSQSSRTSRVGCWYYQGVHSVPFCGIVPWEKLSKIYSRVYGPGDFIIARFSLLENLPLSKRTNQEDNDRV